MPPSVKNPSCLQVQKRVDLHHSARHDLWGRGRREGMDLGGIRVRTMIICAPQRGVARRLPRHCWESSTVSWLYLVQTQSKLVQHNFISAPLRPKYGLWATALQCFPNTITGTRGPAIGFAFALDKWLFFAATGTNAGLCYGNYAGLNFVTTRT